MARASSATTEPEPDYERLRQDVDAILRRVEALESERPGRKAKPLLAIRQRGVCAVDPTRDSATCPDASIYRYQIGCHGDLCRERQHEAYERRKPGKPGAKISAPRRKKAAEDPAPQAKGTTVKTAKRISKRLAS